jgi:hypothetical protein
MSRSRNDREEHKEKRAWYSFFTPSCLQSNKPKKKPKKQSKRDMLNSPRAGVDSDSSESSENSSSSSNSSKSEAEERKFNLPFGSRLIRGSKIRGQASPKTLSSRVVTPKTPSSIIVTPKTPTPGSSEPTSKSKLFDEINDDLEFGRTPSEDAISSSDKGKGLGK